MKFPGLLLMTVLLQVSLSGGAQTVSISGKDVPLTEIFSTIKAQTGVLFFYDATLLRDAKPVTIDVRNVPLEKALNEIFKGQSVIWVLEDKTVTVVKRPVQIAPPPDVPSQYPSRVKGSITDVEGKPLSSVSVLIKGTNLGTVSDNTGKFSIEVDQKNVLIFSSVNYSSKELRVEKGQMNIKLELDVKPMEMLLVGGNMNVIKRKAEATSVTVIDSKTLERIPVNTIDQLFRGWVPGTNSFSVGPHMEGFPTLSIRGAASSNSLSTIAVYIDGIEYAGGSGYLSQLDKSDIERIEIVRGPGAATMYGTGSNAGIIQIFTKKGRTNQQSVSLTTSAGFYKSKWVKNDPLQQMHHLETSTGFKKVAFKIGGSYRTVDAYLPDGGEKNKNFYGSVRFNIGKLEGNLSGRYNVRNFHHARPPYYDTAIHPRTDIIIEPTPGARVAAFEWYNVRPTASRNKDGITETYITGLNLTHKTTYNWKNSLDVGCTMNGNMEVPVTDRAVPFQRQYIANKLNVMTIRYSNVLTLHNDNNDLAAVITSGTDYKKNSSATTFTRATAAASFIVKEPDNENYGAFVMVNPSYKNVYLSLGMRYEKNILFKAAWNPRIGLTTNFDIKSLTIKPRISWGRGISSPSYEHRFGAPPTNVTIIYPNPDIKPQSQEGFDYGVEVYDKKGKYRFEVLYYDNTLRDMFAQERIGPDPVNPALVGFKYYNVAQVANRGWELSAQYQLGRFNAAGTLSIMNSTIEDTTGGYLIPQLSGKAPGTRMRNLPRQTAGMNLHYNFNKLFRKADKGVVSINITQAIFSYLDYRKYTVDVAYGRTPYNPEFFRLNPDEYKVVRVGLYADYYIVSDLRFFVLGSNILNDYEYEYSSEYPTHGATWLFGLKYNFSKSK